MKILCFTAQTIVLYFTFLTSLPIWDMVLNNPYRVPVFNRVAAMVLTLTVYATVIVLSEIFLTTEGAE